MSTRYTKNLDGGWKGTFGLLWRYQGAYTQTVNQIAQNGSANPSSSIFDMDLTAYKQGLRFQFYVKNLFDQAYTTRQDLDLLGNGTAFFPRDYKRFIGASVQRSF